MLAWRQDFEGRRDHAAGVRSFIHESHTSRLEAPPDGRKLVGLYVALLVLEADDSPIAHLGRASGLIDGPLQGDPGHSALDGQESRARQNIPLGQILRGQSY